MKLTIKNYFEFKQGDKIFVAENTVLPAAFVAISELRPYTNFLAFGTGTSTEKIQSTGCMAECVANLSTETEAIQIDPSKGSLFVRKKVVFAANEHNGLEFSEVGFAFSSAIVNPVLANHALIKSKSGQQTTMQKVAGEELVVTATIFLEIESETEALPILGENKFLMALLGEDVYDEFPTFKIAKGKFLTPNEVTTRNEVVTHAVEATPVITVDEEGVTFSATANLGTGEVFEVVVLANDEPIFRINTGWLNTTEVSATVKGDIDRTAEVGGITKIKKIVSAKTPEGQDLNNVELRKYARRFGDMSTDYPFPLPYTHETPYFVSKEGNRIAFVTQGRVDIYENSRNAIKKLDSDALVMGSIVKVEMFGDHVFIFQSVSPFVQYFRYIDEILEPRSCDISGFMQSRNWDTVSDFDCCNTNEGEFFIAVKTTVTTESGYLLKATEDENGNLVIQSSLASPNNNIYYVAAFIPHVAMNGFALFATTDDHETGSTSVFFYVDGGWQQVMGATPVGTLVEHTIERRICRNGVFLKRSVSPYFAVVFFPNYRRYSISINTQNEFFPSRSVKYIGRIHNTTKVPAVLVLARNMTMTSMQEDFPSGAPFVIEKLEILEDIVLGISSTFPHFVAIPLHVLESFISNLANGQTANLVLEVGVPPGSTESSTVNATFSFQIT